jgi:hypothetical protein
MLRSIRGHFRSNVVGYIALFFALSLGTAWAATELERNEVKSRHLKNGGVKTKDLANDVVTSPKVANASLLGEDFAAGQLPQGPEGAEGPPGSEGPPGRTGAPGSPGQDATKLFGSIVDPLFNDNSTAVVGYGTGVTSVNDPPGTGSASNHEYLVTFSRSVTNCVVHATAGSGDPLTTSAGSNAALPIISMTSGTPEQVRLTFYQYTHAANAAGAAVPVDTSFLVSAFC